MTCRIHCSLKTEDSVAPALSSLVVPKIVVTPTPMGSLAAGSAFERPPIWSIYHLVLYDMRYDMIWYEIILNGIVSYHVKTYDIISYHMGTIVLGRSCLGNELSWVRVVLGTICPGYELSWVRVVLGKGCLGYELSWVRVVLGMSCLGYKLSWVRVVLGTICPGYVMH